MSFPSSDDFGFLPTSQASESDSGSAKIQAPLTTLSQFLLLLSKSGIRGPHHVGGWCLDRIGRIIGEGAQFTVIDGSVLEGYVYKRVRPHLLAWSANSVDLSDQRKNHLKTLWLEISALAHPNIRGHPNIVKLHMWGYDYSSGGKREALPLLIVEKAQCDLQELLNNPEKDGQADIHFYVRYQLCMDVLEGLICLHKNQILHGDIKPANILIFQGEDPKVPYVAKLNDFGLAIPLEEHSQQISYDRYGGTPGWQAPEVVNELTKFSNVPGDLLYKCDVFAFALLMLSVLFGSGSAVFPQDTFLGDDYIPTVKAFLHRKLKIGEVDTNFATKLEKVIVSYLDPDPIQRPSLNLRQFPESLAGYEAW